MFASQWFRTIVGTHRIRGYRVDNLSVLIYDHPAETSPTEQRQSEREFRRKMYERTRVRFHDGFSLEGPGVADRRIMLARIREREGELGSFYSRDRCPKARRVLLFLVLPSNYPCTYMHDTRIRARRRRQLSSKRNHLSFLGFFLGFNRGDFPSFSFTLLSRVLWIRLCRVQSVRTVVDAYERLRKRWQDNGPFKAASFSFAAKWILLIKLMKYYNSRMDKR